MGYMGTHNREAKRMIDMLKDRREAQRDLVKMYNDVNHEDTGEVTKFNEYTQKELAEMKARVLRETKSENRKKLIGVLIAAVLVGLLFYYVVPMIMVGINSTW